MKLTLIEPHVDAVSSYKNFAGENIFFEDVISSQYIYIRTTEVGFEKIRLIAEECVNGLQFLVVPGFLEMEYVIAVPKSIVAYLTSEALSYDMITYLGDEGHEPKFPNIFYRLAYCDNNLLFDQTLLNTHVMSDAKFVSENLDDIKYEIKTEDELCLENENMRVYVHMMAIRVTSTNSSLKLFTAALEHNDIFETLSAKSYLREHTCFMSDYFARDYSLVENCVARDIFNKWKEITQEQYDVVKLASGSLQETDLRIYPQTHAIQQTYFVNLSMMINYVKMAFDVKYACDFFAIAVACDLVRILKNYQHVNQVASFFKQYNYLIEQHMQKVQAYHIAYLEYAH